MSIQVNNKNLGHATAYAYAVAGGYTGTEAEFTELLGNIADDLGQIENLTVTIETLAAGSSATASYSDGVLHLGIPKGDKGDKGDTGATGPTGPTGNGIASVAKTGTSGLVDTYTVTYTNGNTATFTVTNGAEAVDDTLTIAGRAADAKKTGDEISALKSDLTHYSAIATSSDLMFTIGACGENGAIYSSGNTNRINSGKNKPYCIGGTISCDSTVKFKVGYYTSKEFSLVYDVPTNFVKYSDWITDASYNVEPGYYVMILAGFADNANIDSALDVSSKLNISLYVYSDGLINKNLFGVTSNTKLWSQGIYSATSGNYEQNQNRIKINGYVPEYIDAIFTDVPYYFRILAWNTLNEFVGIYKTTEVFEKSTSNLYNFAYLDISHFRENYPEYRFKIYAYNNTGLAIPISVLESKHIYFVENLNKKSLSDIAIFSGKTVAILGDSISTNGNSGIDCNVPEITITSDDVGVELSAYLTYYDVQANLSLGGHTFTSSEIGQEVTFTPTANDIGKSIGLPNNYNENNVVTWWEVLQEELGVQCIPNTWSGASITSHESSSNVRKCSWAWHESQIRKCGIRVVGTMNRIEPDIIIIYRGTNDMTHEPYTLLTDDYFDDANWQYPETDVITGGYGFKEGMCLTIKKLRDAYPNAKIFICTMNVFKRINYSHFPTNNGINTLPQYNNAIREIADFMGCGVIEFDKDGITFENCYSQGYITDSATIPTHPNDKGHRVMGLKAITDLKSQYSEMT